MGEINKIKKDEYDLIIANPPYNLGNKIVSQFVTLVRESIVLMPISYYRPKELYKHILNLNLVDPKTFKDAIITDNLCICRLTPQKIDRTFEALELETFEPKYREFYEFNAKAVNKLCYNHGAKLNSRNDYSNKVDWMITWYVCNAHKAHNISGDSFDIHYNLKRDIDNSAIPDDKNGTLSVAIIRFKSELEKDNFNRYWYFNELTYKLINGLNKNGGSCAKALPNIDWSKDRDYEHCTLDDIMKWLEEDNQ